MKRIHLLMSVVFMILALSLTSCNDGENIPVICNDCDVDTPVVCDGDDCDGDDTPVVCEDDDCDDDPPVVCEDNDCDDDPPVDCEGDDCDDDPPIVCDGDDCDDDPPIVCQGDDCDDDPPVVCQGDNCDDDPPVVCEGNDCDDDIPVIESLVGTRWRYVGVGDVETGILTDLVTEPEVCCAAPCSTCYNVVFSDMHVWGKFCINSGGGWYYANYITHELSVTDFGFSLAYLEDCREYVFGEFNRATSFSLQKNKLKIYYDENKYLLFVFVSYFDWNNEQL